MKYHYKESIIHRIVPNGWLQGGGKTIFMYQQIDL